MSATRWTRSSLNVHGRSTCRHGVARSAFVGAGSSRATYSSCSPEVSACSTSSADFIPCRIIQARPATESRLRATPMRSSRERPPRRVRRGTYAEVPATGIATLCGASSLVSHPEKKLGTASGLLPGSGRSPLRVSAAPAADRRTKRRPMATSQPTAESDEASGVRTGRPYSACMQRLGGLDAAFLYFETPTMHMHVGGLMLIDFSEAKEPYSYARMRAYIEAREGLVPAFRQKLATVPLNLSRPYWIQDQASALDSPLRRIAVPPPGGARETAGVAAETLSKP